jgi:hypothetical protein
MSLSILALLEAKSGSPVRSVARLPTAGLDGAAGFF